ncbi:MAG: penicillin-binding transpeptidase domain-containing protein [Chloroflexota bacterium]
MKKRLLVFLSTIVLLMAVLLVGCKIEVEQPKETQPGAVTATVTAAAGLIASPMLPNPSIFITPAPDVEAAVRTYIESWKNDDFETMYGMLTKVSRDAISTDDFKGRYKNMANEISLTGISYQILSSLVNPRSAQVAYRVTISGIIIGDIQRDTTMNLSLEDSGWHIQWDDALILPELAGGNKLWMDYLIPTRGNIYDSKGDMLVSQSKAVALGIDTAKVGVDYEYDLLDSAWYALDQKPEFSPSYLQPVLQNYRDYGWYLPLGEVRSNALYSGFVSFDGAVAVDFSGRYYEKNGISPHAIGYVSPIQAEEADEYRRKGYRIDQKVGRSGVEMWGEPYLSGKRGGTLYVMNSADKVTTKIAKADSEVAYSIYTTFKKDYQFKAQNTLNGFRGALVVLERDTGRILAMASSPEYDPNAFNPENYNSTSLLSKINKNEYTPLINRAASGQYPLGSVFKIITMAAALESGLYTPEVTYDCGFFFEELPGLKLNDWTWDHVQRGEDIGPSGILTLPEGLMRSCNPFFWHIGLDLYRQGHTKDIANMARGFGLGKATGVIGIPASEETSGQISDPESEIDAVNNAIGQGQTMVTPLQVAAFAAAVGNGGTLYRPQMIERVESPDGKIAYQFQSQPVGKLPIKLENLQVIQEAMKSVVNNKRGTAWNSFVGSVPVAGKTGTAQDPPRTPHAWFAGFTFAEKPDKPDIAAVVIVENQGEGSQYAAPIFRSLVDLYFKGGRNLYSWETSVGVLSTPTPVGAPIPDTTQ